MTSKFRRTLSIEDLCGADDGEMDQLIGDNNDDSITNSANDSSTIVDINGDYDDTAPILQLTDGIESTGRTTKNVRFKDPEYTNMRSSSDKLQQVKEQADDVKGVLRDNVARLLDREGLLDSLHSNSQNLSYSSDLYLQSSEYLRRKMWWRQMRTKMLLSAIIIIGIFLILVPLITKLI